MDTNNHLKPCKLMLKTASMLALLAILFIASAAGAQARTIGGIVLDNEGQPLAGAQVREVPVTAGASAHAVIVDFQGHFNLQISEGVQEIEASFIGFNTAKVKLKPNEDTYKIELEPNTSLLDEIVVTGYQTISKERTTGSFAKVTTKDLAGQRLNNVNTFLDGHVAGYNDGRIRGVTSMNGVSTPLYVIDGFPVEKTTYDGYSYGESVPDVNIDDIESITVLKDASATSIYGARAANGVIVITTKRADRGKVNVNFSASLTFQPYRTYTGIYADAATMVGLEKEWAAQNPNLQGEGAATYAQSVLDNKSYTTAGITAILNRYAGNTTEAQMNTTLNALSQKGQSYYGDVDRYGKRNPFYQQYNLSLGSATEKNNFYVSVNYRNNQAADKFTKDDSFGVNIKNTTILAKWLSVDLGAYINYSTYQTQGYSLSSPGYAIMPYDYLVNPDGSYYTNRQEDRYSLYNLTTLNSYGLYNLDITPINETAWNLTKQRQLNTRAFVRLNFKITDWLKFTPQFHYEANEYKSEFLSNKESFNVRDKVNSFATGNADGTATFNLPYGNIMERAFTSARNYNLRLQLDFNKTFNQKHEVTALAGFELKENKLTYNEYSLYNYDPQLLTFSMINQQVLNTTYGLWGWASFSGEDVAKETELVNRYVSLYANAAYAFDQRYLLNASIRWDRTNLFGTSSQYQNRPIWSVGAGWRINEEHFFNVDWVNNLKLRVSYGIGGNIAKDSAPYMTAWYSTNNHINQPQGNISSRPNPNLRWEKTTTFNVGLDFAVLNNRISGSIDFYNKLGSDLLANTMGVPTEGWGYSTYTINNGKMRNRGVEIQLNTIPYQSRDWTWAIGGVFGYNKNTVTYINVEAPVLFLVFDYPTAYPRIGNPYYAIYAYDWAGLNEEGMPQVRDLEGNIHTNSQPSNVNDAIYAGTTVPVWNGSISTSLTWRQFTLSAMAIFEGGHSMRNTMAPYLQSFGFVNAEISDRWQKPGDEAHTNIPRYVSSESPLYNYYASDLYLNSTACVLNANRFQLRNISLRYELPRNIASKCSLKGASLMLGVENVVTIAKSKTAKYLMGGYDRPNYTMTIQASF